MALKRFKIVKGPNFFDMVISLYQCDHVEFTLELDGANLLVPVVITKIETASEVGRKLKINGMFVPKKYKTSDNHKSFYGLFKDAYYDVYERTGWVDYKD